MVYVRFGDANYPEKKDGCGSQLWGTSQATFTCTYFWQPDKMSSDNALRFSGAALALTEDFNIRHNISVPTAYSNVQVRVGFADSYQKTVERTVNGATQSFVYENILAHRLNDDIVTTLVADLDGRPAVVHKTYSVRQYCENIIGKSTGDATLCTLLSDVLLYGAATQTYASYRMNDLATNVDVTLTPSTFDLNLVRGERGLSGTKSDAVDWKSATLALGTAMRIDMIFAVTVISGLTVGV